MHKTDFQTDRENNICSTRTLYHSNFYYEIVIKLLPAKKDSFTFDSSSFLNCHQQNMRVQCDINLKHDF